MRMKNVKNTQEPQNRPLPRAPGHEPKLHCVDSEPYLVASKPDEYEIPNLNKDSDFLRQQQPGARRSENIYEQPISCFSAAENSKCASYMEMA